MKLYFAGLQDQVLSFSPKNREDFGLVCEDCRIMDLFVEDAPQMVWKGKCCDFVEMFLRDIACKETVAMELCSRFPELFAKPIDLGKIRLDDRFAPGYKKGDMFVRLCARDTVEPDCTIDAYVGVSRCPKCGILRDLNERDYYQLERLIGGGERNFDVPLMRRSDFAGRDFVWFTHWRWLVMTERGRDFIVEKQWTGLTCYPFGRAID